MLLTKIAELFGVPVPVNFNPSLTHLLTDSRSLLFPEKTLFFALKSERNNGHRYIADLYQQGVRAFVVSELPDTQLYSDAFFISVPDTLKALQYLAAHHRAAFDLPVVAITGSNGKTIVKEWLYQLLSPDKKMVRSPRSYNSQIGVALSVWQIDETIEMAIFEAGISLPGEMAALQTIIKPDSGIFTTIGDAHQENFSSLEDKIREKLVLFRESSMLIYCSDHRLVHEQIRKSELSCRLISWGRDENALVRIVDIQSETQSTVRLVYQSVNYQFRLPFTDKASVENALHCIVYLLVNDYSEELINKRLAGLESVAMRMEVKEGVKGCILINDSYNSDVDSLQIALEFLSQQASSNQLSKTLILSDILQSGYGAVQLYHKIADICRAYELNKLIAIGPELRQQHEVFAGFDAHFFYNTDDFLRSDLIDNLNKEAILLKGARSFHFEVLSRKLEKIAHETILEVNLNKLVSNLNYYRAYLKPGTKVMCMVKAFAYGSGSVEIARALQYHRVDYLAVAVADEGAELRNSGIHIPIVVMNPEKSVFDLLFDYQLEPEIYSFRLLKEFIAAASKRGVQSYPVHLKIDSGMHRLGFDPSELKELAELLIQHSEVLVKSVFSHLAGADAPSLDAFTQQQAGVFKEAALQLQQSLDYPVLRHLLNSAGIERFGDYQMEMVRLGIGHYGISSLPGVSLPQVCSLRTLILQLKTIEAGETVGYNRNGKITTPTRIAVLPIGYADGFDRKLGNGVGEVMIEGRRVPVVGNVSMDLITVDVTGLDVEEGDTVEVFGEGITIAEIAAKIGTIPYEILTGISRRVKRVYIRE